jgi:hypothetical protein
MRPALIILLAGIAWAPALAEERPSVAPGRDVDVTYAVRANGHDDVQKTTHLAYSVAAHGFRIDEEKQPGYILMEPRDGGMRLVSDAHKAVVALPREMSSGSLWDPAARLTRVRSDTVAGIACTEWRVAMPPPKKGEMPSEPQDVCLSADGVALRFNDMMESRVATKVDFAPQDASRFRVPAAYRAMSMQDAQRLEQQENAKPH